MIRPGMRVRLRWDGADDSDGLVIALWRNPIPAPYRAYAVARVRWRRDNGGWGTPNDYSTDDLEQIQ